MWPTLLLSCEENAARRKWWLFEPWPELWSRGGNQFADQKKTNLLRKCVQLRKGIAKNMVGLHLQLKKTHSFRTLWNQAVDPASQKGGVCDPVLGECPLEEAPVSHLIFVMSKVLEPPAWGTETVLVPFLTLFGRVRDFPYVRHYDWFLVGTIWTSCLRG